MTSFIQTQGRYFWKDGQRFLIRGVVYRLHGKDASAADPLVDDRLDDLERDITLFHELGLNTLFIYHIDSTRSHDAAMALLADAGIHVLVSLPTSASSRDSDAGITTTFRPYSELLLQDCFATIDCMAPYANTLGIIVANGALSTIYSTAVAPTIKTVIRDVKRYMATARETTGQRQLPIGYSASNGRLILKTTFDYFTAGEKEETVDFFCYANFNWCGESTMHMSGYDAELKTFADAHIPVFFSQYGSNLGACGRRIFQETTALYAPAMTRIFSGGIAHEFYDRSPPAAPWLPGTRVGAWGYGLVREEHEIVGRGLTKLPDFGSLRARLGRVCEVDGMPVFQRRMSEETLDESSLQDEEEEEEAAASEPELSSSTSTSSSSAEEDGPEKKAFPPLSPHWRAGYALPSVADWKGVRKSLEEKVWVEVDAEEMEHAHGNQVGSLEDGAPRLVRA